MPSPREKVKIFIQLSRTPAEADEAIRENFGFKSCKEKIAFLKDLGINMSTFIKMAIK